jgi:hypothetical protein
MTLLINRAGGGSSSTIRNYTILAAHTGQVVASVTNQQYMKGNVFINDTVNSLFFEYSITNFNGTLTTTIFGMIGHEFDISIVDFISGSNVGLAITNNEASSLLVTLIQEL